MKALNGLVTVGMLGLMTLGVGTADAQSVQDIKSVAKNLGLSKIQVDQILNAPTPKSVSYTKTLTKSRATSQQQQIVSVAKQQIGIPFKMGGTKPSTGFDSSGLVSYVYKTAVNKNIGRTVSEEWQHGISVPIDKMQPGDIVFFNNFSYNGIYVGGGEAVTTIGTNKVGKARVRELGTWCGAKRIVSSSSSSNSGSNNSSVTSNQTLNNYYASVLKKGSTIYGNTSLTKTKGTTSNYYNSTFQMKRVYTISGKKYYSAYDGNDNWIGYIAQDALSAQAKTKGGYFHKQKTWYSVTKPNYKTWANFNFSKTQLNSTADYVNQKVYAKGYYKHLNGSTYATLYDRNQWLGYINVNALKKEQNGFNEFCKDPNYVTVTAKGYGVFQSKDFSKKVNTTDNLYQKTYYIKGFYEVADGSSYATLYDKNNNWIGYVNTSSLTPSDNFGQNKGGIFIKMSAQGFVKSPDYVFWNDFNFSKERNFAEEYMGRTLSIRGKYNHFNGSTYYSVYNGDYWVGYINKNGMKLK